MNINFKFIYTFFKKENNIPVLKYLTANLFTIQLKIVTSVKLQECITKLTICFFIIEKSLFKVSKVCKVRAKLIFLKNAIAGKYV